nr:M56 family metallopeptidase [Lachnospiraceae bacterium]
GILAMTLYAFISFVKIKRSVREAAIFEKGIMECDDVKSPFILGILRPVIYVPSGMDSETLELVLAHEKAHMKRRDHIWKPLGYALLSVYWFNPLSWIAYILLCRDIESACDEKVIRDKSSDYMAAYSQALLDCSIQRRRIAACPVAFGETGVKMRIKNVLSYKKPAFWIILASLAVCVVLAVCFLTDPQKDETISEAPAEVETPTVDESDNFNTVNLDEEGSYDLPDNGTDGYTYDYYSEDSSVYIKQDNATGKSMIVDGVKVYPVDIAMGAYGSRVAKFDADGDGVDKYLIAECEGTGTGVSQYGLCIVETDGNSCKLTRYDSQYFADYLDKNVGYQWDDEKQEFNVFTNTSGNSNAGSGIHVKPFERHSDLEEIVWSDIISIEFEDGHVYLSAPTGYVYKDSPVPDYENAVRVRIEILVQEDSSITLSNKHSFVMDDE